VRKSKSSECLEKIRSTVFIFFEILSGTSAAKFFCENTLIAKFQNVVGFQSFGSSPTSVVFLIPSSAYFFVFGVGNFTDPCLMSTCHELHGNTTNILHNLFHRTFHAIPMVESEACECQVNDYLICSGFTSSSFFKFGRAELPNF
jgi:hypothetical protein